MQKSLVSGGVRFARPPVNGCDSFGIKKCPTSQLALRDCIAEKLALSNENARRTNAVPPELNSATSKPRR